MMINSLKIKLCNALNNGFYKKKYSLLLRNVKCCFKIHKVFEEHLDLVVQHMDNFLVEFVVHKLQDMFHNIVYLSNLFI